MSSLWKSCCLSSLLVGVIWLIQDGKTITDSDGNTVPCPKCFGIGWKSRDHDHLILKNNYRGVAHYKCNINYRQNRPYCPVLAHNAFRFDFQLMLEVPIQKQEEESIYLNSYQSQSQRITMCL